MNMKTDLVLLAAGKGSRLGGDIPKPWVDVAGKPLLLHSLGRFNAMPWVKRIVLVTERGLVARAKTLVRLRGLRKVVRVVPGGARRQDSVANGVRALGSRRAPVLLIHDSARPFPDAGVAELVAREALRHGAAVTALPASDTIKRGGAGRFSAGTVPRAGLWLAQTPQAVRGDLVPGLLAALAGGDVTDDVQALESSGVRVRLVRGSKTALKVTDPEDLALARLIATGGGETRAGFGFDLHRLVAGRRLVLGGVRIPFRKGLEGHSDADIVCHSLADAVLGAAGLGDMGTKFGVRKRETRGMSSIKFLTAAAGAARPAGWRVVSADATLLIQEPRIGPHREKMRKKLAHALGTTPDRVSVKATTAKRTGPVGRGEAMACFALVTLSRGTDA